MSWESLIGMHLMTNNVVFFCIMANKTILPAFLVNIPPHLHPWTLTTFEPKNHPIEIRKIIFHPPPLLALKAVNFPGCKVRCGCLQQACLFPQMSGIQLFILEVLGRSDLYQLPSISIQYVAINQILPEIITCPETASVLCTYLWLSHKPGIHPSSKRIHPPRKSLWLFSPSLSPP